MTTVALIGKVGGHYRFVAQGESISTHVSPWNDITVGVCAAVRRIEQLVGRSLLTGDGQLIRPQNSKGDGVDAFVVVSSAAAPLQVVISGLTEELSLAAARRAVNGCAAVVGGSFSWGRSSDPNEQLAALNAAQPDLVVVVGGTDGGAAVSVAEIGRLLALFAESLPVANQPLFMYAGNVELAGHFVSLLGDGARVVVLPNVLPTLDVENTDPLRRAVDSAYREQRLSKLPGMENLGSWTERSVVAAHRSFGQVIRYVGERYGLSVMGLSIGSGSTVAAASMNEMPDVGSIMEDAERRSFSLIVRSDAGVGRGARHALSEIPIERILRWLHFDFDAAAARNVLMNRGLHPTSVAETEEELFLEYAFAREIARLAISTFSSGEKKHFGDRLAARQWDLIMGAGRLLARSPSSGLAALVLLDSLEPRGVSKIAIDVSGVANALGALASVAPLAAVDVVEYDAFLTLGTLVAPFGMVREGETSLELRVQYEDGNVAEERVTCGSIKTIPLKTGERALLELHPTRYVDIGLGLPGQSASAEAEGGPLGIVIDARGRPLQLPQAKEKRQRLITDWLISLGILTHRTSSSGGVGAITPTEMIGVA